MKTLVDVLKQAADYSENVQRRTVEFYIDNDHIYELSYSDLYKNSGKIAGQLKKSGIKKGDYVVLQIIDMRAYLYSFWACQMIGAIPVPLPVSRRAFKNSESDNKIANVRKKLVESFLLFDNSQKSKYDVTEKNICISNYIDLLDELSEFNDIDVSEDDVSFVQFSSGSTSEPKGIVLKHKNIIENMRQISERLGLDGVQCCANWMPLTHDMGFIAFHLMPLKHFSNSILFATDLFLRNPLEFLRVAGKSKSEFIGLSNSMIEMIIKISKNKDLSRIDLSNLKHILNGSEPINCASSDMFNAIFAKCGLSSKSMCYCYGMAEASLVISLSKNEDISRMKVDEEEYYREKIVPDENSNFEIPFVGQPLDKLDVIIADNDGKALEDGQIGEICIRGKNVMESYLNMDSSQYFLDNGFFKTGDKGFIFDNKIAIIGRIKDIIFKNGVNYYSHDLERIIIQLYPEMINKVAIVQANQKKKGRIIMFVSSDIENIDEKFKKLNIELVHRVGFMVEEHIEVKEFPRTESGKIQRFKLLVQY